MVQKYIAVFLVLMLSGLAAPAFAGDFVNMKLIPQSFPLALASPAAIPPATGPSAIAGTLAYAMPQSSQGQPAQPSQAKPVSTRHWSKAGKIMTVIGIGLAGAGGFMMTRSNQTISTDGDVETQINWKATGALTMSAGAVLAIIGLTRHSD
jgi:hypothetical protein